MPETPCSKCNDVGYITTEKDGMKVFVSFCDCQTGQLLRKTGWTKKLEEAEILKAYHDFHFENFQVQSMCPSHVAFARDLEYYLQNIQKKHDEGKVWLICGTTGVGKTLGASLILKEALKKDFTARYILWTDLIDKVFNEEDLVDKLREVDFLVIDGLGHDKISKTTNSRFVEDLLEKVVKYRFGNKVPTILISSIDPRELQRRFPVLISLLSPAQISLVEGVSIIHKPLK